MEQGKSPDITPPQSLRMRFLRWRNGILSSRRFQRHAARNPLLRPIARKRASALFDLVAGFTYTQTLLAFVESGLLDLLSQGPAASEAISKHTALPAEGAHRLLRAAAAIDLVEEGAPDWWVLGRHGAALSGNNGALAMIRHHRILYSDLADPMALLKDADRTGTELASFWAYSADTAPDLESPASAYSQLMAESQSAVVEEVLAAFPFRRHSFLLDIGGGNGTFLRAVAKAYPHLRLGLFDLPRVVTLARERFASEGTSHPPTFHEGSFFSDPIPAGYDCVSLVRILHDHDDEPALQLLANIRKALVPGAQLLIAEPMAETRGAEGMGDAYFGLYLWAMGSGRPRSAAEIRHMLEQTGFTKSRIVRTDQPLITSLIVATA